MKKMSEEINIKRKMIFAKATVLNFCAIVVYQSNNKMMICDILETENIENFIEDVEVLARKHIPELLHYECTVYLNECKDLRNSLHKESIKVRGYKSEGSYMNRIVSQASWIQSHVKVNKNYPDFIEQMMSFSVTDPDKTNIALDVLSDATKYFRRNIFK